MVSSKYSAKQAGLHAHNITHAGGAAASREMKARLHNHSHY
jgi:hypothetical protein